MLNQKLQQKLLQKLSPQQIQLIKLLEVPTIQLEQRIKKEIEENPVLEEGKEIDPDAQDNNEDDDYDNEKDADNEEFSLDDYIEEDDIPNYKLNANNYSKDDKKTEVPYSEGSSFHEFMHSQLGLRSLNEEKRQLAEYLIGNLDSDGYLRRGIEAIVDDLAFSANISTTDEELLNLLYVLQDFEPAGVAARDLRECLMIQVDRKRKNTTIEETKRILNISYSILRNFFTEFSKKHYDKILSKLNATEDDLKYAMEEIIKLNPKPGNMFSSPMNKTSQHIIPDFVLEDSDGELVLSLNSKNVPDLRISKTYANMIDTYSKKKKKINKKEKDTLVFVKQKLDSAKWFIEAIKQRQNTLMLTMQAIIDYQKKYFKDGDETQLRPMILKDIAERTDLDISTISRVANSKYIQTHFGIFPLKYFFSEGMQTDSGEEVSTREIKKILKECIDNESKKKPLTDEKLAKILQERGYQIARRTVAKYREQMNILVARLRKEL